MHTRIGAVARSVSAVVVAVAGVVAVQASAATSGQAASGLTRVVASSPASSATSRQVAAVCPPGQRVFGGGAEILNGQRQVVLQQLQPQRTAADERFVAGAREVETGYDGAWRLRAYAMCGQPLPGQQILTSTAGPDSNPQKTLNALCPTGQGAVGIGARVGNGGGQVRFTDLYDFFGTPNTLVIVGAREEPDGYQGAWSLTSSLVCADVAATAGFVIAGERTATNSQDKTATFACPTGTRVHATGTQLAGQFGAPQTTASLIVDKIAIDPTSTSVTVRVVEDQAGTPASWSALGFALCAP